MTATSKTTCICRKSACGNACMSASLPGGQFSKDLKIGLVLSQFYKELFQPLGTSISIAQCNRYEICDGIAAKRQQIEQNFVLTGIGMSSVAWRNPLPPNSPNCARSLWIWRDDSKLREQMLQEAHPGFESLSLLSVHRVLSLSKIFTSYREPRPKTNEYLYGKRSISSPNVRDFHCQPSSIAMVRPCLPSQYAARVIQTVDGSRRRKRPRKSWRGQHQGLDRPGIGVADAHHRRQQSMIDHCSGKPSQT